LKHRLSIAQNSPCLPAENVRFFKQFMEGIGKGVGVARDSAIVLSLMVAFVLMHLPISTERRAQCFSDIGEYAGAYRDIIRLRGLGSVSADVQKLAAEIEEKAPEAVMMVTEEASRKLTPSVGGKGMLSGLFRIYLAFYAGLMSLSWFIAVVIILLAILHGAIAETPKEGWSSARESIINFLPLLWLLLVAGTIAIIDGLGLFRGLGCAGLRVVQGFGILGFRVSGSWCLGFRVRLQGQQIFAPSLRAPRR
jgi:hypothetical protein